MYFVMKILILILKTSEWKMENGSPGNTLSIFYYPFSIIYLSLPFLKPLPRVRIILLPIII